MKDAQIEAAAVAAGKAAQAIYGAENGRGVDPEYREELEILAGETAYYEARTRLTEERNAADDARVARAENKPARGV